MRPRWDRCPRPTRTLDRKNLRAASALLDAAGWEVGSDGMRRNAKGETLKVEFLEDSPAFERVINPYVENLRALGVDAVLTLVDSAQMSQRSDPPAFDFDIIVGNAVNGYEPGGEMKQAYASVTANNSTRNRAGLANPAVDKLLDPIEAAQTRAGSGRGDAARWIGCCAACGSGSRNGIRTPIPWPIMTNTHIPTNCRPMRWAKPRSGGSTPTRRRPSRPLVR
ncbi:MAG: ABC transporter substrate-binding protein [Cypionkella sp.]